MLIIRVFSCFKVELILVCQLNGRPKVDIGKLIKKLFKNYFCKYVVKHNFGTPIWLL